MRAAVLHTLGGPPEYGEFTEPTSAPGHTIVRVAAAGVHHYVLHVASGSFYTGPPRLPSVPGSDGVGRLPDGRRVYFDTTRPPFGSWAEYASVPEAACLPVAEGIDDATAAALGNTGLAAWTALQWRAGLRPDETVLVLGATGSLGRVAIQAAKALGAGRVVAADLDSDRLRALTAQGADAVVAIDGRGDLAERLRDAADGGADVTIDPLWGAPALAAMQAAAHGARHIQLGTAAGETLEFTAAALRSHMIDLRGFAVFRCPIDVRRQAYRTLTRHVADGAIAIDLEVVPLSDVATAWHRQLTGAGTKLVLDVSTAPHPPQHRP
ncbi:quinone oxidoreductase family protein [Embleya scabrispora]|uniref:quinone oxidoreductase family protein n=1 Tax=Embleya scabrispora TaxID=159449 RepID=UPI00036D7F06|nr:zinc-binding alcohol dehydrogenase family protein [Embleya scabrispora]MYS82119.1 zinc-binding dehydrogenase [Streptomyces sp. SID5474]